MSSLFLVIRIIESNDHSSNIQHAPPRGTPEQLESTIDQSPYFSQQNNTFCIIIQHHINTASGSYSTTHARSHSPGSFQPTRLDCLIDWYDLCTPKSLVCMLL